MVVLVIHDRMQNCSVDQLTLHAPEMAGNYCVGFLFAVVKMEEALLALQVYHDRWRMNSDVSSVFVLPSVLHHWRTAFGNNPRKGDLKVFGGVHCHHYKQEPHSRHDLLEDMVVVESNYSDMGCADMAMHHSAKRDVAEVVVLDP